MGRAGHRACAFHVSVVARWLATEQRVPVSARCDRGGRARLGKSLVDKNWAGTVDSKRPTIADRGLIDG